MFVSRSRMSVYGIAGALLVMLLILGSVDLGMAQYGCGRSSIGDGSKIPGSIRGRGGSCDYKFYGQKGDHVTITLIARSTSLDPYLELYKPYDVPKKHRPIATNNNDLSGSANSKISKALTESGWYIVRASSYRGLTEGYFWIELDIW